MSAMDFDEENNHEMTPLVQALCQQIGRVSFHMPGHRQGIGFPYLFSPGLACLDTTELGGTGDLAAPSGHVLEAYRLAAQFFGAKESWIITSGTTASIFIMMAGPLREGDQIIIPRAVHMAAVHAVAVLGLIPIFVDSEEDKTFPDGQPNTQSFIETIERYPSARACFVTRPDYYGRTIDLAPIAQAAHRLGMTLLVDEAHGAHFAAAPDLLPATALAQGADITCQSAHKTLPALTPASFLHISRAAIDNHRIDHERVSQMVKIFQTSSPSFLIAATADAARSMVACEGHDRIKYLIRQNADLCEKLPDHYRRVLPTDADPTRLVLDYSATGLDRLHFLSVLDSAGIDAELVDSNRVVFLPALDQSEEDYRRLSETLRAIKPETDQRRLTQHQDKLDSLTAQRDKLLSAPAGFELTVRQSLFGRRDFVQHAGKNIATQTIAPYPPGMPIVWPGEIISDEHRIYMNMLEAEGIAQRGVPLSF
ncbi:MAG: aminotransferase class I/II-fold pyridoxal phosphate-dependent enzyme [Clostridiaceae bacterium]|nr:aminotransferase class I/II-fold pyridoxal phosphate-dependent enzyme [Clostridiaceae bacterium]